MVEEQNEQHKQIRERIQEHSSGRIQDISMASAEA
jgi:hypothetical protein